jgi:gliding motility-associated-like protein
LQGYVTLAAQASPQATITWLPPLSGSTTTINVFLANTYEVEIDFCGITTIASVEITQNTPTPTIQVVGNNQCPGEVTELFADPGWGDYIWNPGNHSGPNYNVFESGTYQLTVTDTNGCIGVSPPFDVFYYPISPPDVADASVCFAEAASLFAAGNYVFWSLDMSGNPIVASGNVWTTPEILEPLTVYVFREDATCRSTIAPIQIGVEPGSEMQILTNDTLICAGTIMELLPSDPSVSGAEYLWTTPLGEVVEEPILQLNNPTQNSSGWYVLQVEANLCLSRPDSVYIDIEDPNQTTIIDEENLVQCIGQDVLLMADWNQNDTYWITPQGIVEGELVSITQAGILNEGIYMVFASGAVCEEVYDSVEVDLREYPVFDLQPEDVYCEDGYMTAHIEEGFDNYVWNSGDTDANAIVPLGGYVYVEVTNWPSCTVTDSLYVENIDCIDDFPNVFTPNGDGDNDYVDFGWLRIPIDEVHIYNRWGNLVRRLIGEPFVWNGRDDGGNLVSDAVYYYVISSSNAQGHFHNVEGYIHTLGSSNGVNGQ